MGKTIDVKIKKKLNNFDLSISFSSNSSRIGILGESGAGKSMTLKCIAGIETLESGFIKYDDRVLYDKSSKINLKPGKRKVGYLFQNYALFPTMTVYENVSVGNLYSSERVHDLLKKFDLEEFSEQYPAQLSGGQQQRVALARLLIGNPDMILLDEPFSALDYTLRDKMQQQLELYLNDYEGTVIMVSHNRDEIYRLCDEVLVISEGKIIEAGEKKQIFMHPLRKETARMSGCKNIAKLERIDEHNAYVPDWDMNVRTGKTIPENAKYIGCRAHDFELMYSPIDDNTNIIKVSMINMAELPFEMNLYYKVSKGGAPISCFVQRDETELIKEKGIPDILKVKEDKMLFLED